MSIGSERFLMTFFKRCRRRRSTPSLRREGESVRRGRGHDTGLILTVEPFLIRGLDTAYCAPPFPARRDRAPSAVMLRADRPRYGSCKPRTTRTLAVVEQRKASRCGEKGAGFRVDGLRNQVSAPERSVERIDNFVFHSASNSSILVFCPYVPA